MPDTSYDTVLVVDFGAQYAQLIARRVREARVYSEIVPSSMPVEQMLAKKPKAIILSGGPSSVYAEGAPQVDRALFETGVPTFGICYGFQAMAAAPRGPAAPHRHGGVGRTPRRHGGPHRHGGVRPHPSAGHRRRAALRRTAGHRLGLDVAQRRCFRC